ncbi:chondroitinase [Vibrio sinaloensis]|uniref:polysaccharide lyase family 8 super-sandwich domain-containing protein n=1 Tax=Photobacterium sp. (strain ATCC 43367) TaxID=379097 RepID=UPI00057C7CAD|nr:polysaccharide lyase family 8 super-sandwich domain-containing protein [Vibrio sinaloensis]KIE20090.1 chondroitinase [Vibrio sinaloensis]
MISQHLLRVKLLAAEEVIQQNRHFIEGSDWGDTKSAWQTLFEPNSGWPDINLHQAEDDGQIIQTYLRRVLLLACDAQINRNQSSVELAREALVYWFRINPTNWNWWWNQIGKQRTLGPIGLLLESYLPSSLRDKVLQIFPKEATMTGANRADLAHAMAFGALLSNDEQRFQAAMQEIRNTITITLKEGMQPDYSYHQHGPQLQNGGYGESFYNVALPWCYVTLDTVFAFPETLRSILSDYFLQGSVWMTRNGRWDYNVCGRAIAKPDLEKPYSSKVLAGQARMLCKVLPQNAILFKRYQNHLSGEGYPFSGYKCFWRSDYAIAVSERYSLSIKANSCRTSPIETGNQENLLGYWLGFGSMNLAVSTEEYRDIFPMWNWCRVPGVTNPQVAMPAYEWGRTEQKTHWTGGVSNTRWGVFTFELDSQKTQALKSWFFFDGVVVALGAGICSDHTEPVVTTINQCHYQNSLWCDAEQKTGELSGKSKGWLHHGDIGYVLHGESAQITCETRTSSWWQINHNLSDTPKTADVFELVLNHGEQPSNARYQYTLLPAATIEQTRCYAEHPTASVIRNTKQVQAVVMGTQIGCVFYEPTPLTVFDGLVIKVDRACVLMCDNTSDQFELSLATPGYGDVVNITITERSLAYQTSVCTPTESGLLGSSVHLTITK